MRHAGLALLVLFGLVLAGCALSPAGTSGIDTAEQEERNRNWNGPD